MNMERRIQESKAKQQREKQQKANTKANGDADPVTLPFPNAETTSLKTPVLTPPDLEWQEPVELKSETEKAPIFPLDVFPQSIQEYILRSADSIGCSLDYCACSCLGIIAASIGATCKVHVKDNWFEQANLWIALVGDSSQKKTPPMVDIRSPYFEISKARAKLAKQRDDLRKRRRNQSVECEEGDEVQFPIYEHDEGALVASTATIAGLHEFFRRQRRGLLYNRSELSGWFEGMNQFKKGGRGDDRAVYLELYDGSSIDVIYGSKTIRIPNTCLSILGGIQPDKVPAILQDKDGLSARFLWCYPDPIKRKPEEWRSVPFEIRGKWNLAISRLLELNLITEEDRDGNKTLYPNIYSFSDSARKAWTGATQWIADEINNNSAHSDYISAIGKMEGVGIRLSLSMRLLDDACEGVRSGQNIDAVDIEKSLRLCQYFAGMAHRVYRVAKTDKRIALATRILEWIKERNRPLFKRAELYDSIRHNSLITKPEDLIDPIELLRKLNWLRYRKVEGQRGSPLIEANPKLLES
jgi:hypothetical protein